MTALIRLRLSGRALSSLGLLMLAVMIAVGAPPSHPQGTTGSARTAVTSGAALVGAGMGDLSAADRALTSTSNDSSSSAPASGGTMFGLLPQHARLLVGAVVLIGFAGASQPYWVLALGLGLYASAAAGRNRLRRLFSGRRHGTRAPPVCF